MTLNFDDERKQLAAKRAELMAGVSVIDRALATLTNGKAPASTKGASTKAVVPVRAGRKPMSPKDREAARKRMLAYWAEKRKAQGKAKTK